MPQEHPGIFYENISASQAVYEQEHQAPKPGPLDHIPKAPMAGCILLLLCLLLAGYFAGKTCDPSASAMTGRGDLALTNREFSVYYWTEYRRVLSQAQESGLPFDPNRPLDRQYMDLDAGTTWEDYFMDAAAYTAAVTMSLSAEAQAQDFLLPEAAQAQLDAQLAALAQSPGTLQETFGPSVTEANYRRYLTDRMLAEAFAAARCNGQEDMSAALSELCSGALEAWSPERTPLADVEPLP